MDRRQILHTTGSENVLPSRKIETAWTTPKIGIVAVGGMGSACMPRVGHKIQNLPYLDRTIAIETSRRELSTLSADHKILLGDGMTPFNPNDADRLTYLARPEMADALDGLDMVLLVAGMGGNTGIEIARIVARNLRQKGIFTLSFAVMPFDGEGLQRQQNAKAGVQELQLQSNALIPVFNNDMNPQNQKFRWHSAVSQRAPLAFIQLCRSITNSVARADLVGIDFKDLQNVILGQDGHCAFGFGSASGVNTATVAAQLAIDDPLLGLPRLKQASAALVTIETPPQSTMAVLRDAKIAMNCVRSQMPPNASIIYGVTVNPDNSDKFTVSILASGIQDD